MDFSAIARCCIRTPWLLVKINFYGIPLFSSVSKVKQLASECHMSDKCIEKRKRKDNPAACLYFLSYLSFLWPASDRPASALSFVGSRGRSDRLLGEAAGFSLV
jgi:hypothetical protein